MNEVLARRTKMFEELARDVIGLDYFPIMWEVVPEEVMLEIMSYGLPTRARHWSYGQSYEYQKNQGEMGMSKVYELVINGSPNFAFLLDSNSNIANTMIIAHVLGHVHIFKNNFLFKKTNRKMVYQSAERAARVEEYITQYGIEAVERTMDTAFAMEKNINWHKGFYREPYGSRKKIWKKRKIQEFDDMFGLAKDSEVIQVIENESFPPNPESDLLWFFANHARLDPWQKDIFEIIREESFYFYPQYYTKVLHEGGACIMHTELMKLLPEEEVGPAEFLEFVKIHERVVQPGNNKMDINPYFLGFTVLCDVREKWDEKFKNGESDINGMQKILQILENEDDISFLRSYLTQEIVDRLEMFTYIQSYNKSKEKFMEIKSTRVDDVVEYISKGIYNYRSPVIEIHKASATGIELKHISKDVGTLDPKHLEKVMGYIYDIWPGIVDLETIDNHGTPIHFTYDEEGFSITDEEIGKAKIKFKN